MAKCETEVHELLRQVDQMVEARKLEWAKEKESLLSKLEERSQELILQTSTLSQKNGEVNDSIR